jgi:hypothetical protein
MSEEIDSRRRGLKGTALTLAAAQFGTRVSAGAQTNLSNSSLLPATKPGTRLDEQSTLTELWHWFFDDYVPRVVAAWERGEHSSFITGYWGAPLGSASTTCRQPWRRRKLT